MSQREGREVALLQGELVPAAAGLKKTQPGRQSGAQLVRAAIRLVSASDAFASNQVAPATWLAKIHRILVAMALK